MSSHTPLTRHPEGSLRELWSVSFPLMISSFAMLFMIFTDRIFLAHYSVEALNASVNAGTLAWAFMSGMGMIAAMSEVFVAQYNGAKLPLRIGAPVWQMIWFSLFSFSLFIPLAVWGGPLFFRGDPYAELEIVYFRWLMFFGPSYALMTACTGFFIGRGKTTLMIWLAVLANGINIVLDWLFIFGVKGWIPELGIQGAAVATCIGYVFQAVVLFALFLRKENRDAFGVKSWRINWSEMFKCLKVGTPQGLFCAFEIGGWAFFFWLMSRLSEKPITISSICQSVLILLFFFSDGLSRGAAAIAGNFIGSQRHALVSKVFKSSLILFAMFLFVISLVLVIDPIHTTGALFFAEIEEGSLKAAIDPSLADSLKTCLIFSFFYLLFDGPRWVLSGLLSAAGDTVFLLVISSLSIWLCLLLPIYAIVVQYHLAVEYAWGFTVIYAMIFFFAYWVRFRQGAWRKIDLVSNSEANPNPETTK